MARRARPYESFGPYILFKKIEEDSLGDLWRAGKISGATIHTVALHRLSGGNNEALRQSALQSRANSSLITGTSIVKNQVIDLCEGMPLIEHDYNGGRSLRHIVAKARSGATPRPLAPDQALAIAEKVAAAVELVHNFKRDGIRAVHGAIIPRFIWIEVEGEIRAAGQQLGQGLLQSLSNAGVAREIGPYFAPEVRNFGEPSAAGDIYAVGAILYLVLTGNEPPDPANSAQFAPTLARATLMTGEPVPQEIRSILNRSLAPDINTRYPSAGDLRREIGALIHGGAYAPTTFNLAFYLHNLLKKEFEGEAVEREKETQVSPAAYRAAGAPAAPDEPRHSAAVLTTPPSRSRTPLITASFALVAIAGFGAWWALTRNSDSPSEVAQKISRRPLVTPQIITAVTDTMFTVQIENAASQEAKKKRIEAEVQRRLQAEMMKLQAQHEREQERSRLSERAEAARAPDRPLAVEAVTSTQAPQPRLEEQPAVTATVATATVSPTPPAPQPQPVQPEPADQTQPVREGDLVGVDELDQKPEPRSPIRPVFPPIALRQRLEANVFVTALISETGRVLEVKVLRGDPRRLGFDEAAVRAVRNAAFSPAIKDGRRVRTWLPIPIRFQP